MVLLNGHQNDCGSSSFANTFASLDQVLQANGQASIFFDSCSVKNRPSIEKLGSALGGFLGALRYQDGTPVDTVDIIAHSMGGLIVRSYLSGKQEQDNTFSPPVTTHIRKAVFLATPHFGTGTAAFGLGLDQQLDELSSGSHFLSELAAWNDGTDDLRGIDAVAIIGNGGTGLATMKGFDDGVVALTSASLGFYQTGRTRILPLCHTDPDGLTGLARFCDSSVKGIAKVRAASDDTARVVLSFLNGTAEWQTVGQAAEQNPFLSTGTGIYVRPFTAAGAPQKLNSATVAGPGGANKKLNQSNDEIGYTDFFPSGLLNVTASASSGNVARSFTAPAGTEQALILKPGPSIARVLPSAAPVFPFSFAPRMIVSIYGSGLARSVAQAQSLPLPVILNDVSATLNGQPLTLLYVSPTQINAVLPGVAAGFVKLAVQNPDGAHSVSVFIEAARPAIFTVDASGSGPAAALKARNGQVVSPANALQAGDYVELFVTGLGLTTPKSGLEVAVQLPSVSIDGVNCPVSFAGAAPGFAGLDQINCLVPQGLIPNTAAVVIVASGGRTSNAATLAVR